MFEDKKILILGMARSGYEACKYLSKHNNTIILNDITSIYLISRGYITFLINSFIFNLFS